MANIHPNDADLNNANSTFRQQADELWAANRSGELDVASYFLRARTILEYHAVSRHEQELTLLDKGPYSIAAPNVAGWLPLTVTIQDQVEALATKLEQQDFASLLQGNPDSTVVAGYGAQMKLLAGAMRSSRTSWTRFQINPNSGVQGPVLMQSFQRGSININTTDPWNTEPVIDYNALSNPVELDVMAELVKFNRRVNFNTSLVDLSPVEVRPGSNITSDEDIKAYIAQKMNPSDLQ